MRLLFKQRIFSWLDSYDIYDEHGNVIYIIKGKLSFGHCLYVYDVHDNHIATLKEEVFTLLPRFQMFIHDQYIGQIKKEFTFFKPSFILECNGWKVKGEIFEWDYQIYDRNNYMIASVSKEFLHLSDTYTIDVYNPNDALYCLLIVLAIDAEKCSRND
jgi:uncharacterized protein YxjI